MLSIPERAKDGLPLFNKLCEQASKLDGAVEVLCYLDNKSITVGDKWNALVSSARGAFIANVYWGIGYRWQDKWDEAVLWRPPFERMAIRADHKRACPYPPLWTQADQVQMNKLQPLLKREVRVSRTLEHHMYSTTDKPCLAHE
jgi:hypothetical protein